MGGSSVLALSSLYRYDDHEEDDDHEGDQGGDQGDEEGRWQSGEEGPRQEDGGCHEEEGGRYLRSEDAQLVVGGYLRLQVCAPHRGDQEDLGLHQEELVEQRPHHQAGRDAQGHLPGCEPRYAQDGLVRLQALVLRSWGAPATQPKSSDVAPGSGVAAARVALEY